MKINSYDIDGVLRINDNIGGLYPGPNDVIITGRSFEERPETEAYLRKRGIKNQVFYNLAKFDEKTRESSGQHKAVVINHLIKHGYEIQAHLEDDEVQARIIEVMCPLVEVIRIVHNLTEKENVRHLEDE